MPEMLVKHLKTDAALSTADIAFIPRRHLAAKSAFGAPFCKCVEKQTSN
jgi:hypothetical protein